MRTRLEFSILKFQDEAAWRYGVEAIISAHPNSPLNPRGNFEIEIPQEVADWARRNLKSDLFHVINTQDRPAGGEALMWQDLGRGTTDEVEDEKWLEEQADKLEEDNQRRIREIFA